MATKIYISATTGLTVTLSFYDGAALTDTAATAEIGTTGEYFGTVPVTLPAGDYNVIAYSGATKIASGDLLWDGYQDVNEMVNRLHIARGLNISSPATNTLTTLTAGTIQVNITGDLETTTTYTAIS